MKTKWYSIVSVLIVLFALVGCVEPQQSASAGAAPGPATLVVAATVTPHPTATTASAPPTEAPPAPEAQSYPPYGHADDWSWVAGRILPTMQSAACWQLQYDPTGKDPQGGVVVLAYLPEGIAEGDLVVAHGRLQSAAGTPCAGYKQMYFLNKIEKAQTPLYGHADDYSWLAGQYTVTRIQGGCAFLTYDPNGNDQYNGQVSVSGDLSAFNSGDWIILIGAINTGPHEMCPAQSYTVERAERQ
jgi:hypothetical protein